MLLIVLSEGICIAHNISYLKKQLEKGRFLEKGKSFDHLLTSLILSFFSPEENNGFHTSSDKESFQLENAAVKILKHSDTSLSPPDLKFLRQII